MWAVVFPGQGSQSLGMGKFYYENFSTAKKLFEEAEDVLKINLKKLCLEGPEEELTLTQNTQSAMTLVSCAAWFCLKEAMSLDFIKYSAGHSVGEYSALTATQTLSFASAMQAVRRRGLWMNEACPAGTGGMSALMGPSSTEAKQFCQWVEKESSYQPLETANFNSQTQTVLSGSISALKWAQDNYKKYTFSAPARLIPLKVSGPFHSSLMAPASEKMAKWLANIHFTKPVFPVVQNTNAQAVQDPIQIRHNLVQQIKTPVLWSDSIRYLHQQGCRYFLELGHGKVLASLVKKIIPTAEVFHFHSMEDLKILQDAQVNNK